MIDFRNTYANPTPDSPLEFTLTPEEREKAAFNQAQLRFDAAIRNAEDAKREGRG